VLDGCGTTNDDPISFFMTSYLARSRYASQLASARAFRELRAAAALACTRSKDIDHDELTTTTTTTTAAAKYDDDDHVNDNNNASCVYRTPTEIPTLLIIP
jgi:hypothetical protein